MLQVRLAPTGPQPDMLAGAGLRGASTQIRPDGTFVFTGVAPGNYIVKTLVGRDAVVRRRDRHNGLLPT